MNSQKLQELISYGHGLSESDIHSQIEGYKNAYSECRSRSEDLVGSKASRNLVGIQFSADALARIYKYESPDEERLKYSLSLRSLYDVLALKWLRCLVRGRDGAERYILNMEDVAFSALRDSWIAGASSRWLASEFVQHWVCGHKCKFSFDFEFLAFSYGVLKKYYGFSGVEIDERQLGRFSDVYGLLLNPDNYKEVITAYLDDRVEMSYARVIAGNADKEAWFCGKPTESIFPFEILFFAKLFEREHGYKMEVDHELINGWSPCSYDSSVEDNFSSKVEKDIYDWEEVLEIQE